MEIEISPNQEVKTSEPLIHAASRLSGDCNIEESINVEIKDELEGTNCDLWIAFKKHGVGTPMENLQRGTHYDFLLDLASSGVEDREPCTLLTDTTNGMLSRFLICKFPGEEFRKRAIWTQDICERISGLGVKKLGVYFAESFFSRTPELGSKQSQAQIREFFVGFLSGSIEFAKITNFVLLVGENSYNHILNTAIVLKQDLALKQSKVQLIH